MFVCGKLVQRVFTELWQARQMYQDSDRPADNWPMRKIMAYYSKRSFQENTL